MKYINDKEWAELLRNISIREKGNKETERANKGELFETLVELLLKCMFEDRDLKFSGTKTTHDGSKDFWAVDEENNVWWAECKNYTPNIALKQLAPTLFMADLHEVNHLMFFSYSELNGNIKRRISQHSHKHKKEVYIYDNEVLENLIRHYWKQIVGRLLEFKEGEPLDNYSIDSNIFYEKNPKILNIEYYSGYYDIEELRVGEIYNIDVIINNKHPFDTYEVELQIKKHENNAYFDFLNYDLKKPIVFIVKPNQIILKKITIRVRSEFEKLKFPDIIVTAKKDNNIICNEIKKGKAYKCYSGVKDFFIGKNYEDIVKMVSLKCINKFNLASFMIYGKGGTGKTRILEEVTIDLIKNNYKILNFTGFDRNSSWKDVIKEIMYQLYSISDDIVLDILCNEELTNELILNNPKKEKIIQFFKVLKKNEYNLDEYKEYYKLICEQFHNNKYAIVIDNLQSYSIELLDFLNFINQYSLTSQRNIKSFLLYSLNTDLVYDDNFYTFLSSLEGLHSDRINSSIYVTEISGFEEENQAVAFLQTVMKLDEFPLHLSSLQDILSKTSLRPKYLELMANYLIRKNVVQITDGKGYIVNPALLEQQLRNVPKNFETLFTASYRMFLDNYKDEPAVKNCISVLYYFTSINTELIQSLRLNRHLLGLLVKQGIIDNIGSNDQPEFIFTHDLVENTFNIIYPDLLEHAVTYILMYKFDFKQLLLNFRSQYNLSLLLSRTVNLEELKAIHSEKEQIKLQNKFRYKYYYNIIINTARLKSNIDDGDFIKAMCDCCKYIRDHISEKKAEESFDFAWQHINLISISGQAVIRNHFSFIIHYCENKIHLGKYKEALTTYFTYIDMINSLELTCPEIKEKLLYAKAYCYNRIFVCGKFENNHKQYIEYLNDSQELSKRYEFYDIMFENYFDQANIYLVFPYDLKAVEKILTAGFDAFKKMDKKKQKQFLVNKHSKKILLLCLKKEFQEALNLISEALKNLDDNHSINYHLFFRSRYEKYKIICLFMDPNSKVLEKAIQEYERTLGFISKNFEPDIYIYKLKYAYRMNNKQAFTTLFIHYLKHLKALAEKQQELSFSTINSLEELVVKYKHLSIQNDEIEELITNAFDISQINDILSMNQTQFDSFYQSYQSKALITDTTGKDGYFY